MIYDHEIENKDFELAFSRVLKRLDIVADLFSDTSNFGAYAILEDSINDL